VVTDETKSWAKEAIKKEASTPFRPASNSLAVLYFNNKTGRSDLDVLRKGIAIVLMTDLAKVNEIQLVERVKLQALAEELDLGTNAIVDAATTPRIGKLLGAALLVGGDILMQKMDRFEFEADLLKVPTETTFGNAAAAGKLIDEFFLMEKELLFDIIRALKIELAAELQIELKKNLTESLKALQYFVEGIEHSDCRDYTTARKSYVKALEEDPNFTLAEEAIKEIDAIIAAGMKPQAYTKSDKPEKRRSGRSCRSRRNTILRGLR
jgi:TolB-like protein